MFWAHLFWVHLSERNLSVGAAVGWRKCLATFAMLARERERISHRMLLSALCYFIYAPNKLSAAKITTAARVRICRSAMGNFFY